MNPDKTSSHTEAKSVMHTWAHSDPFSSLRTRDSH